MEVFGKTAYIFCSLCLRVSFFKNSSSGLSP
ncbi:hypothetical protein V512_004440 [Mesotoga sp. Brook.08.105.5.1]|nr:hypothetical protein V512_004440 [Mesotoga sp. Brook.08.105.5.1]